MIPGYARNWGREISEVCDGKDRKRKFDLGHNKEKVPTFTNNNKTTNVKMNGEILQIRGKRKLMDRILVASRSQSQIDLPKIFRTYEFSFVHLSIFARGGKDKSVIATQLRESQPDDTAIEEGEEKNSRKVLIIDAMAIVNKVAIRAESIEIDFACNFS